LRASERFSDNGLVAKSQELKAKSQELKAKSQELKAKSYVKMAAALLEENQS
jgi:uncharacterized protein YqfA (UPF0365 family)